MATAFTKSAKFLSPIWRRGSPPWVDPSTLRTPSSFDEANERIYVHQGSSCDLCRERDPERATVLAFNLDGTGRRIFASGLRNAIGLALHPLTGAL